ncbi:NHL repeat-containing protein [Pyxidicoccus trucidator]|uniref:NHL repeat-containing protein n=1 Tax=Pyxidicoccus trucidator TaxID=2709662 RepID=UPI0013DD38FC|nr:NHL repeat-containing protein [Pyxidicoccus trucidator]
MPGRLLCLLLLLLALPATAQEFGPAWPLSLPGGSSIPIGVGVDPAGRVLVTDSSGARVLFVGLDTLTSGPTWSDFGLVMDFMSPDRLHQAVGVAVDGGGNAWVVDSARGEVQRYRYDAVLGSYVLAAVLQPVVDGLNVRGAQDVAVSGAGAVYLLDTVNFRVLKLDGPKDTTWSVWRADPAWGTCNGLDVAEDGETVYLASRGRHVVLRVPLTGPEQVFGRPGSGDGELNGPRDVAVLPEGRLLVADTDNHRVVVLEPGGAGYTLGAEPLFDRPERVAFDGTNPHVVDSTRRQLISFLVGTTPPTDVFVSDYAGDPGHEETPTTLVLASPDLLVRNAPDVDVDAARVGGLGGYAFQQPRAGQNNFVYVAVRNLGALPAFGVQAQLSWADPVSLLSWPSDWKTEGFYTAYEDAESNLPGHTLSVEVVPAATTSGGVTLPGFTVVGPLVWRPAAPGDARTWDGRLELLVRLVQAGSPLPAVTTGLEQVRLSNDVGRRAVVASRGPARVGPQDTLVVRARFAGSGDAAPLERVQARLAALQAWLEEVSYGRATVRSAPAGPFVLEHDAAYYARPEQDALVDLTQELLEEAYAADPTLLDGTTTDPSDDVDRVVVVLNDAALPDGGTFPLDRATPGEWEYTVAGTPRRLTVSLHGPDSELPQYAHGYAHQLGLEDLHVDAPRVGIDGGVLAVPGGRWDVMALPAATAVHPLAASKALAPWLEAGSDIHFIPRPHPSVPRTGLPVIPLHYQSELQPGQYGAIAIGLTPGVTTFEQERQFYWVEARTPTLGNADLDVPANGVLVSYVNRDIRPGYAPVLLRDATPATPTLDDAVLTAGQNMVVTGLGLTVAVPSARTDAPGGFNVRVDYAPPPGTDVYIRAGEPRSNSPDIWVDFPGNGEHADPSSTDEAVPGTQNWVYARVHNAGDQPAYDVEVRFSFSDPFYSVSDEDQFVYLRSVILPYVPARGFADARIQWTPAGVDDPHRCVKVELRRLYNDLNLENNEAQKNLHVATSTAGETASSARRLVGARALATAEASFTPVGLSFQMKNTRARGELVLFRVEDAPPGWEKSITPERRFLSPGATVTGSVKVTPPPHAQVCDRRELQVTAWASRGDTLVRLGSSTLDVGLREPTGLTLQQALSGKCERVCVGKTCYPADNQKCARLEVKACVTPAEPGVVSWVEFREDKSGVVHHAPGVTNEDGCFTVSHQATQGGVWRTTAVFPGSKCLAPARAETKATLALPISTDQDKDGVPDKEELHGDYDKDGLPNVVDPDSDNDGIPDGQEKSGEDHDMDGLPDVIDPGNGNW